MTKQEKLAVMDKILREIEDLKNSETSLVKKIGQIEAENINLGNKVLETRIPDIFEHIDAVLTEINTLQTEFEEAREKFVKDNKLDQVEAEA